ncbi:MAG: transglutaminase domain-containing protein [Chloroflexi bacterium]|nr:transglutaminase domain-containing protein [Chloroflexota bacterium]MBM4453985.1 transglutaminase domain-containing protein [Chloroflexota bacterium]
MRRGKCYSILLLGVLIMTSLLAACAKPAPAAFEVVSLQVLPSEVMPGEPVIVNVEVENVGGVEGNYEVELRVNAVKVQTRVITLGPKEAKIFTFELVKDIPGRYSIQVDDLSEYLHVLKPADFVADNLLVLPTYPKLRQNVTITADLSNFGDVEDSCSVKLLFNEQTIEERKIKVTPGASEKVIISFSTDKAGRYTIDVANLHVTFMVTRSDNPMAELKTIDHKLYQELLKLPDLQEIDNKDEEALEDIALLASDPKNKPAFEAMLAEGMRDERKYCTPLEALLWIAYDGEFYGSNLLSNYSLTNLINEAWKKTTISNNYASEKWENFDQVVDRLNSPLLVSLYMRDNITHSGEFRGHSQTPLGTFNRKKGQCSDMAVFAAYILNKAGYDCKMLIAGEFSTRLTKTHAVCLYNSDNEFYTIDNGIRRGPFPTIKDVALDIDNRHKYSYEGYELYDIPQTRIFKGY